MNVFENGPYLPEPRSRARHNRKFFETILMTPRSIALMDRLVAASAEFEVGLRDVSDGVDEGLSRTAEAYGAIQLAKKDLAEYMAALMDRVDDPALNRQRTVTVRYD